MKAQSGGCSISRTGGLLRKWCTETEGCQALPSRLRANKRLKKVPGPDPCPVVQHNIKRLSEEMPPLAWRLAGVVRAACLVKSTAGHAPPCVPTRHLAQRGVTSAADVIPRAARFRSGWEQNAPLSSHDSPLYTPVNRKGNLAELTYVHCRG